MDATNQEDPFILFQNRRIERLEKQVHELEEYVNRLLQNIAQCRQDRDKEVGSLMQKLEELEIRDRDRIKYGAEPARPRQDEWKSSEFDIFISYSRHDQQKAKVLATALEKNGLKVWWDQGNIRIGENFETYIAWALEDAMRVVVLWSRNSLQSRYVYAEARIAYQFNKLLPVILEDIQLPDFCADIHAIDLSSWAGDSESIAFKKLVDDLKFYRSLCGS